MCFCCCCFVTKKSNIIYMMVISIIGFCYGIVSISNFASKTDNYKYLKEIIDLYEKYEFDFNNKPYGIIKRLKGIENGFGILLFTFTLIFIGVESMLLYFTVGDKKYRVLSAKIFNILNLTLIISLIVSGIFIVLSFLYGILLFLALGQYIEFIQNYFPEYNDFYNEYKIKSRIIIGFLYGFYQGFHFLTLTVGFGILRNKFNNLGFEGNPGPLAQYDINGNIIIRQQIPLILQGQFVPGKKVFINQPIITNQPFTEKQSTQIQVADYGNKNVETNEDISAPQIQNQNNEVKK